VIKFIVVCYLSIYAEFSTLIAFNCVMFQKKRRKQVEVWWQAGGGKGSTVEGPPTAPYGDIWTGQQISKQITLKYHNIYVVYAFLSYDVSLHVGFYVHVAVSVTAGREGTKERLAGLLH
jgi:hypothetical protein